jgi:hypothetical protein
VEVSHFSPQALKDGDGLVCMAGRRARVSGSVVGKRLSNYAATTWRHEVRRAAFLSVKSGLTSSKQVRLHPGHEWLPGTSAGGR